MHPNRVGNLSCYCAGHGAGLQQERRAHQSEMANAKHTSSVPCCSARRCRCFGSGRNSPVLQLARLGPSVRFKRRKQSSRGGGRRQECRSSACIVSSACSSCNTTVRCTAVFVDAHGRVSEGAEERRGCSAEMPWEGCGGVKPQLPALRGGECCHTDGLRGLQRRPGSAWLTGERCCGGETQGWGDTGLYGGAWGRRRHPTPDCPDSDWLAACGDLRRCQRGRCCTECIRCMHTRIVEAHLHSDVLSCACARMQLMR
jgi:hypothetical protein